MSIPGAVILGGAHGALGLARSLGRIGVPVCYVTEDMPLPRFSRFVGKKLHWPGPGAADALRFLGEAAELHGLRGSLLVPAADAEVEFVSRHVSELSAHFKILLTAWDSLEKVHDKSFLYPRARELNIAVPNTYRFASVEEAMQANLRFPVVLKRHMGGGKSLLSKAKALRADEMSGFAAFFREAVTQEGIGNVVVQEMIPGGGEAQFSYAALWNGGAPLAEFTARRARQYPLEFGYTSTYVEVVDEPEARDAARALLASIGFSGLVEIEFKRDRRDNALKLLDVNPRPWSWFGLAAASGVDLGAMMWDIANGRTPAPSLPKQPAAWMYLVRDFVVALRLMAMGRLGPMQYLRSFRAVRAWASFASDDPVPGLIDVPLTIWRVMTRRLLKLR